MTDEELQQLAREISAYIAERPEAADTLEGLINWWISRQRLLEAEHNVRRAVEFLVRQGVIEARVLPDGSMLYRAVPPSRH